MPFIYKTLRPQRRMERMWRELHRATRSLERFARRNELTVQPVTRPANHHPAAEVCRAVPNGMRQYVVFNVSTGNFMGQVTMLGTPRA